MVSGAGGGKLGQRRKGLGAHLAELQGRQSAEAGLAGSRGGRADGRGGGVVAPFGLPARATWAFMRPRPSCTPPVPMNQRASIRAASAAVSRVTDNPASAPPSARTINPASARSMRISQDARVKSGAGPVSTAKPNLPGRSGGASSSANAWVRQRAMWWVSSPLVQKGCTMMLRRVSAAMFRSIKPKSRKPSTRGGAWVSARTPRAVADWRGPTGR